MSCINATLVQKLADCLDILILDELEDKKDKLRSKLYMKKLELVFSDPKSILQRCVQCSQLYTKR